MPKPGLTVVWLTPSYLPHSYTVAQKIINPIRIMMGGVANGSGRRLTSA